MQTSGYTPYLMLCGNQDRLDNLNELKASVREYVDTAGEETDAESYLNGIALLSAADDEGEDERVKLMTVHTAKGLEFPCVFVCGLNEGMFPSCKIRTKQEMEEERRVAYVALTRAEQGVPHAVARRKQSAPFLFQCIATHRSFRFADIAAGFLLKFFRAEAARVQQTAVDVEQEA